MLTFPFYSPTSTLFPSPSSLTCHCVQVYVLTSDDDTLVKFYTSLYHTFTPPTQFTEVRLSTVDKGLRHA